jgi:hypothetical protein
VKLRLVLQFRHCGRLEGGKEGKRAAGAIGGGFWESVLKRKKKAMIWAGYFSESRK